MLEADLTRLWRTHDLDSTVTAPPKAHGSLERDGASPPVRGLRARHAVGRAAPAWPEDPASGPILSDSAAVARAPQRSGDARGAAKAALDVRHVRRFRCRIEPGRAKVARSAGRLGRESAVRRNAAAPRLPVHRVGGISHDGADPGTGRGRDHNGEGPGSPAVDR